jgi:hypothetical protein
MSRIFLTELGFIRVGFLRTDRQMNKKERQKWIEILEGVELVEAGTVTKSKRSGSVF